MTAHQSSFNPSRRPLISAANTARAVPRPGFPASRVGRLVALARHHLSLDRTEPSMLVGEREASLKLYRTSGRRVFAAPINAPATLSTSGRSAHRGEVDEQHT